MSQLKEILSITGKPGLYRYVAKGRTGIIVEALEGGKRLSIPATANVSTLADIAIYTESEELPLATVLTRMAEHEEAIRQLDLKKDTDGVQALFAQIVPGYDALRVYPHHMQKAFRWYLLLTEAGITDFSIEEPEEPTQKGETEKQSNQE